MSEDPLAVIARTLRLRGRRREQVLRELSSHLQASAHDLQLSGRHPAEARSESVRRFGDSGEIAGMLTEVHRPRLPRAQSIVSALAILVALSAWLGTSHTFASSQRRHSHATRVSRSTATPASWRPLQLTLVGVRR